MSLAACLLMLLHHNLIPAFDEKPGSTQFIAAPIEIGIFGSISSLEISYFLLAFSIRHLFDSGNYLNASFQSCSSDIFSVAGNLLCCSTHERKKHATLKKYKLSPESRKEPLCRSGI